MEKIKIKKSIFGYNVKNLEHYINNLNEEHSICMAEKEKNFTSEIKSLKKKIAILEMQIQSANVINNVLEREIKEVHEKVVYWEQKSENQKKPSSYKEVRKKNNTTNKCKYQFSWELLGDIDLGRPNLGNQTRVEVYRLLQFTIRDILEKKLGTEKTEEIFYQAGKIAGKFFYENMLVPVTALNEFISQLQRVLKEVGIGILQVEKADMDMGELILTVSEDLDCSGLPDLDYEICSYDEGFIAALIESFTGLSFSVKEIDCWCTGDRTCRFHAIAKI